MKKLVWILSMVIATPLLVWSQASQPASADQESRKINSLSDTEVQAYLNGRGMGLAKPAELNNYPGPIHVLELADNFQLSTRQKSDTQKAFERMHGKATRLGKLIVEKEGKLNELFADGNTKKRTLRANVDEISRLQGELRVVHLAAHLEIKRVLSPDQIKKYNELRGYGTKEVIHQHKQ